MESILYSRGWNEVKREVWRQSDNTVRYKKLMYLCIQVDTVLMYYIEKSTEFDKWLKSLRDLKAKAKILFRIQKIETEGYFGDCKHIEGSIRELRIYYAKGYRVYFSEKEVKIILLLIGGEKSSQQSDIKKAKEIWKKLKH